MPRCLSATGSPAGIRQGGSGADRLLVLYDRPMPRPVRTLPRDLAAGWPDLPGDDPYGEVARRFAENLRLAIGNRTLRAVAEDCGLNHTTILAILEGRTWPDLQTLAKLERGVGADLWPGRLDR